MSIMEMLDTLDEKIKSDSVPCEELKRIIEEQMTKWSVIVSKEPIDCECCGHSITDKKEVYVSGKEVFCQSCYEDILGDRS